MGSLASLESNRSIYLKCSRSDSFDPYSMSQVTLRAFFDEMMAGGSWLSGRVYFTLGFKSLQPAMGKRSGAKKPAKPGLLQTADCQRSRHGNVKDAQ